MSGLLGLKNMFCETHKVILHVRYLQLIHTESVAIVIKKKSDKAGKLLEVLVTHLF